MEAKPSHALMPRSNKQLHTTTDIQKQRRQNVCAHAATHKAKSKNKVARSCLSAPRSTAKNHSLKVLLSAKNVPVWPAGNKYRTKYAVFLLGRTLGSSIVRNNVKAGCRINQFNKQRLPFKFLVKRSTVSWR